MTVNEWQNVMRQLIDIAQGATNIDVLVRVSDSRTLRLHSVFTGCDLGDPGERVVIWSPLETEVHEGALFWDTVMDMGGRQPPGWEAEP